MSEQANIKIGDIEDAMSFVSSGELFGNAAWLCRDTGEVFYRSDEFEDFDPVPEDIEDADRYIAIPDSHDLELGKPLVLDFARAHLPDYFEQIRDIFSHRGAYARFKDLLGRHKKLEAWYQWEQEKTRDALREWCAQKDIKLAD